MSTKITRYDDDYGCTLEAMAQGGVVSVYIRRTPVDDRAIIMYPMLHLATADHVAIVYDMLGQAIQIARDIDSATARGGEGGNSDA